VFWCLLSTGWCVCERDTARMFCMPTQIPWTNTHAHTQLPERVSCLLSTDVWRVCIWERHQTYVPHMYTCTLRKYTRTHTHTHAHTHWCTHTRTLRKYHRTLMHWRTPSHTREEVLPKINKFCFMCVHTYSTQIGTYTHAVTRGRTQPHTLYKYTHANTHTHTSVYLL